MKDLKTRIVSGVIGLAILIGIVKLGGVYLNLSLTLLSLIGLNEFYNAVGKKDIKPIRGIGYSFTILIFVSNLFGFGDTSFISYLLIGLSLTYMVLEEGTNLVDAGVTCLSILYVPYLFNYLNLLDGQAFIWLVFIIAFSTDSFAYFGGNFFGKTKLAPKISPNKTLEGFISGIIGGLLSTVIFWKVLGFEKFYLCLIVGLITPVISQLGDLAASKMKRFTGVKDYGKLIPGHGGVLDRFDSILFTSPVIYYLFVY